MSFEFNLPNFQVDTPAERRMYAYLYQTVQQLNWAMKHIQTEDSQGYVQLYRESGKALSRKASSQEVSGLRDLIIKSADVADAFYSSISRRLQGQYTALSDFGTFREQTELSLEATDKRIEQNYQNLQQISSHMARTNAYIRTGLIGEEADGSPVYGLEIGQTDEINGQAVFNRYARFSSSRLSFYDQNDTLVAYISDYKLYITNVHITGSLTMGRYEIDTSDGLAFRWVGGEA